MQQAPPAKQKESSILTPRAKIIAVGDSSVGKTSTILKFTQVGHQESVGGPTLGSGFYPYATEINGSKVIFDIWDTCGQEMYRSLVPQYLRNAMGVIIVFDLTSQDSFDSLEEWYKLVDESTAKAVKVLFGNKLDLFEKRRVQANDILEFTKRHNLVYIEGSALTGIGIQDLFLLLFSSIVKPGTELPCPEETPKVEPEKKKGGCC